MINLKKVHLFNLFTSTLRRLEIASLFMGVTDSTHIHELKPAIDPITDLTRFRTFRIFETPKFIEEILRE